LDHGGGPHLALVGCTASGKSAVALEVARCLSAAGPAIELVSVDSMQVYRGMDVGTAKPTAADQRGVAHHLLDLVDPDAAFSVADFVRAAGPVLEDLAARRAAALLVGGTGLWLRAVATGLDVDASPADPGLRASLEAELTNEGLAAMAARLTAQAPIRTARTDLRNPRRVVRALEIATLRGDGPPARPLGYGGRVLRLNLTLDPAVNHAWIERRAMGQLDGGLPEEAALLRAHYGSNLRSFSAIGYHEALDLLDGRLDRAGFLAVNVARNVAFSRRQRTWFRADAFGDVELDLDAAGDPLAAALDAARRFLAGEPVS
jgi:tRNA dimethylallyltransferase